MVVLPHLVTGSLTVALLCATFQSTHGVDIGYTGDNSYGHPGYHATETKYVPIEDVVDPLLEQLEDSLNNQEVRESYQLGRLSSLSSAADGNVEFVNKFTEVTREAMLYHQRMQNDRIRVLEDKISKIQALRSKVQALQADSSAINDAINTDVYPARKKIMYDIEDLQNADLERTAQIGEIKQQVQDVVERMDLLFEKSGENTRATNSLRRGQGRAILEMNVQKGDAGTVVTQPGHPTLAAARIDFQPPLLGTPQASLQTLSGFHAVKGKGYSYGNPSLYFGTYSTGDKDGISLRGIDMSSGAWKTKSLPVNSANIYFGTSKLSKPDLGGI